MPSNTGTGNNRDTNSSYRMAGTGLPRQTLLQPMIMPAPFSSKGQAPDPQAYRSNSGHNRRNRAPGDSPLFPPPPPPSPPQKGDCPTLHPRTAAFRVHGPTNVLTFRRSGTVILYSKPPLTAVESHRPPRSHPDGNSRSRTDMEPAISISSTPSSMLGRQLPSTSSSSGPSSLWTDFPRPSLPKGKLRLPHSAILLHHQKSPLYV